MTKRLEKAQSSYPGSEVKVYYLLKVSRLAAARFVHDKN
jgi:hypothetical protein